MASNFLIQIVHKKTGDVVQFEPGRSVEKDFVDSIVTKLAGKGVGVFRTTAHVEHDVRAAIEESIFELKAKV